MKRYLGSPARLLLGLTCALVMGASPGEGVAVAAVESSKGNLCRTFPQNATFPEDFPSENASSVGVCALARPEMKQPNPYSHIMSFQSSGASVVVGINSSLSLWLKAGEEKHHLNDSLKAEAWNMVCVGLSVAHDTPTSTPEEKHPPAKAYQVWASLQGLPLDVPLGANITEWEEDVKVCVGTSSKRDASFTGFVTGVTLQVGKGELTPDNCSLLLEANQLTAPLNESWTPHGPVFALEEDLREPCNTPVLTLVLRETWDHDKALRWCRSLGGHFPTEEVTVGMMTLNCTSEEHLSWTSDASERKEGPTATCPVLLASGGVGRLPCLSELECSLCQVPAGLPYTLFGALTDFDRHYRLSARQDGFFFFQGETSNITRSAAGWTLQSRLHRRQLHLNGSVGVMGRRAWRSSSHAHAADTLTFTVCNAIQFSSDDGVCVLRSERCDGRVHAPDMSDEEDCGSRRLLGKDAHYDPGVRPFAGQKLTIYYMFEVMVVNKMETDKGLANVELNLHLRWEDDRLRFVDTKMGRNSFPCHQIWTPTFLMFAGYYIGPAVHPAANRTLCYLYWEEMPRQEHQLDDPLMGRYMTRANISQYNNFVASYPCLLRVSRYPFGKYMCNLTFSLFGDHENVDWKVIDPRQENGNPPILYYYGDHDLLDYKLEKITLYVHNNMMILTLHLIGQPDYHLINNFLPSTLMFFICYSSFFFPIAGFNERIMVSLTSLLVLVALFSQATDSYVKTPYYKLIDVWYVSLIILCFLVVIANGVVNYLRVQRVKSHSSLMKKVVLAKKLNIASQAVILCFFGILVFIFALFSTNTF
ncbi:uncharacterized protein LOC135094351 [Scylla paramamosain]|uniref:uncharacterized protein LOC135094351 n=1 Tax=Scylla paramamosain TaxID=85552 RepID=UPI0030834C3B